MFHIKIKANKRHIYDFSVHSSTYPALFKDKKSTHYCTQYHKSQFTLMQSHNMQTQATLKNSRFPSGLQWITKQNPYQVVLSFILLKSKDISTDRQKLNLLS